MTDDDKTPPPPATPPEADTSRAPAVHSDALWGGPRLVENATAEPVPIETKSQYWELLNRTGLRMKDQQESSTGPAVDVPEELKPLPPIVVRRLVMDEAHVLGAFEAILRRYRLVASLWCEHCFKRGRHHGVRYIVRADEISITCRCGTARYLPPTGTTDAVLNTLNLPVKELDTSTGTVLTAAGPVTAPTVFLHQIEDVLIRRWLVAMRRRGMEPRLFHLGPCHPSRSPHVEDESIGIHMTPEQLVLVCRCPRQLFYQRAVPKQIKPAVDPVH
jgi:hypothetical protein